MASLTCLRMSAYPTSSTLKVLLQWVQMISCMVVLPIVIGCYTSEQANEFLIDLEKYDPTEPADINS